MAIIAQPQLFHWDQVDQLGDLQRLRLVLEHLPDQPVIRELQRRRGKGRDDYPIGPMFNALLAGVVFQHPSAASLLRELSRNGQLRQVCGFDLLQGQQAVPTDNAFSNFLRSLLKVTDRIEQMFEDLVDQLAEHLPDLGEHLALDAKALPSFARRPGKDATPAESDGRRDTDADVGKKTYTGQRRDGSVYEKVKSWFGYQLHLIVDANYDLPVAWELTKASANEMPQGRKLVAKLAKRHKPVVRRCEALMADKGLDDTRLHCQLWDEHRIRPVIDIRDMWQHGQDTLGLPGHDRVMYDPQGQVYCWDQAGGRRRKMAFGGFEQERQSLKFRCPAHHHGIDCPSRGSCPIGRQVRVKLSIDRRVFTPLARCSYRWKDLYKKRSSVERVNSRLDVSLGFERHTIRGEGKMRLRVGLALAVMLAMALGRIKEKRPELMRSLVRAA